MNSGSLNVVNATIADNVVASSSGGGGLESYSGTTALDNTIVALNTDNLEGQIYDDNIASVVTLSATSANNLIGTVGIAGGTGGSTNGVNGNRVGVANPGLGPLAGNGGPTQTMALLAGSPAIEHGSVALDAAQTTDHAAPDTPGSTVTASSISARTSISSPFPRTFTPSLPA